MDNWADSHSGEGRRLRGLFGAITSAMQPARLPVALLAVLLLAAFTPLVDLAGGRSFGARGLSSSALPASERDFLYQRARSAVSRVAGPELADREAALRSADGSPSVELGLGELRSLVREGTRQRIRERQETEEGLDEDEERRLRNRAASAMAAIAEAEPRGVATAFLEAEAAAGRRVLKGMAALDLEQCLEGLGDAVFGLPAAAVRAAPLAMVPGLLVLLSGFAVLAGASCRMAAVHAGRGARLGAAEGGAFARARVLQFASLPVLPVLVLSGIAALVAVFALLLRVPVLNLVAALLFVVPALLVLLGAILAVVSILAFPLMPAAVAVEDCDAGDAITRAVALVLSKPLLWLGVLATSIAVLVLGSVVVQGVLGLGAGGMSLALGALGGDAGRALASGDQSEIAALFGPDHLVGSLVGSWTRLYLMLGGAYLFSLACDLATRSYLLMRSSIDGESPATLSGYGIR